ncbi:hypothetical protein F383_17014 [Gossypium arboreum]|uniref:Uncharacterized protein n=1 Tax=Gossypium arboreum TaxID=29729 RepID=A0A0B0NPS6_GOSAR|nr:hypothetical protein F383_17014 [Gossypium arboreum]
MPMREYHLSMSSSMNFTIMNDATYFRIRIPNAQLSVPYLFELRLLLTSKYMSHAYIVHHPLRIKACHTMNVTSE